MKPSKINGPAQENPRYGMAVNYIFSSINKNLPDTSPIYVVGHSGLTRYSFVAGQDNLYHDPSDHP
jgi:hypothetical protein